MRAFSATARRSRSLLPTQQPIARRGEARGAGRAGDGWRQRRLRGAPTERAFGRLACAGRHDGGRFPAAQFAA
jgi:allantoicase